MSQKFADNSNVDEVFSMRLVTLNSPFWGNRGVDAVRVNVAPVSIPPTEKMVVAHCCYPPRFVPTILAD